MSTTIKKPYRKRRLFPRTVQEVVRDATQPMMNKQGKLYGALLRDWAQIVGTERAGVTRPARLQFTQSEDTGAILHLDVRPAAAPEMAYMQEQMLEQCARYFGYRAITRIVLHATHGVFTTPEAPPAPAPKPVPSKPLPSNVPADMRAVFERLAAHVASASDKKK
ncbi:MAG: DUF721 domain-containing protein [Pseudomonadota bacterium]